MPLPSRSRRHARINARKLTLESLESRRVLAATDLDGTFNFSGRTTAVQLGSEDRASSLALQSDGKIVAVGTSTSSGDDAFAIARFLPDGAPDTTLDGDGLLVLDLSAANDQARAVAVQPDDKIVVVGTSGLGFTVLRLNPDGSPDTTFNGTGRYTRGGRAFDVALQSDGKILVAGNVFTGSGWDFQVVRLRTDGLLDFTFGSSGVRTVPGTSGNTPVFMQLQGDGRIALMTSGSNSNDVVISRLNGDGTLDTTLDGDGILFSTLHPAVEVPKAFAVQSDGKLVVAVDRAGGNPAAAIVRFNTDGSLDTLFGGTGEVVRSLGVGGSVKDLVVQSDGRILLVGSGNGQLALLRLNGDGSPDTSFDIDGFFSMPASNAVAPTSLLVMADSRMLVGGSRSNGSDGDLGVVRFLGNANVGPILELVPRRLLMLESQSTVASVFLAKIRVGGNGTNNLTLAGPDAALFEIVVDVESELHLKAGTLLDYATQRDFSVTVDVDNTTFGGPIDDSETFTLHLVPSNGRPRIALDGAATYQEEDLPLVLSPTALFGDVGNGNFAGGKLNVLLTAGGRQGDMLTIRDDGDGVGQIGVQGTSIRYEGVAIGTFTGGVNGNPLLITLGANASVTSIQALARSVSYHFVGTNLVNGQRTVTFVAVDGEGKVGDAETLQLNIVAVNSAPLLNASGNPTFVEGSAPILMAANATVSDFDSPNFFGGVLQVQVTPASAADRYGIRNQGTGAGRIGVNGTNVTYGGAVIGSFTLGGGATPLTVDLNAFANAVSVQALIRNLTFQVPGENPASFDRVLEITLDDGDGAIGSLITPLTITVVAVNDAPAITITTTASYRENAAGVVLSPSATVTDVDSFNFGGGQLTVSITAAATADDRVEIRLQGSGAGKIDYDANFVYFGGVNIGTYEIGVGAAPLTVNFNAAASLAAVQALLRNITFRTLADIPSTTPRNVQFVVTDGDGGTSNIRNVTVSVTSVNDAPVIGNYGTGIAFTEGQAPVAIAATATVSDSDSPNFAQGRLIVRLTAGASLDDRITIRPAGSITTNPSRQVLFNGTLIGTFSGGGGATPLTVNLNGSATPARVQALLRSIAYHNVSSDPTTTLRTVWARVFDGDGAASAIVTKSLTVTGVNAAPVLGGISGSADYQLFGSPISIATGATLTDSDSPNLDGGKLTIEVTSGQHGTNQLTFDPALVQIDGNNAIRVNNEIVGFLNTNGGRGLTKLEVTFTNLATAANIQLLLRAVQFSVFFGSTATGPRNIAFSLTDGDGGTSATLTKSVNVSE